MSRAAHNTRNHLLAESRREGSLHMPRSIHQAVHTQHNVLLIVTLSPTERESVLFESGNKKLICSNTAIDSAGNHFTVSHHIHHIDELGNQISPESVHAFLRLEDTRDRVEKILHSSSVGFNLGAVVIKDEEAGAGVVPPNKILLKLDRATQEIEYVSLEMLRRIIKI